MFEQFEKSPLTVAHINYKDIPTTMWTTKNLDEFNAIYEWLYNSDYNIIKRTRSGGIAKGVRKLRLPAYDLRRSTAKNSGELTVLTEDGFFRLQMRFQSFEEDENGDPIYGTKAFRIFKAKCKEFGINLDSYAITNGAEVKQTMEKQMISLERKTFADTTFDNAHHIDFHSSHPAGIANTFPEFRPVIEWFYKRRKEKPEYKTVLNCVWGYMQSIDCNGAKWAHISAAALKDTNNRIKKLAAELKENGRTILAYNTDGIWYVGDIYHGAGEGPELGQWENDHTNCRIRFKSAGSYEYIEDGVYHPVVRGKTKLDIQGIPRNQWKWGAIYSPDAAIIKYYFVEGKGFILKETDDYGLF